MIEELLPRGLVHSFGTQQLAETLPNGLRTVKTWYGSLILNPDGSVHGRYVLVESDDNDPTTNYGAW